ncbi:MAG: 6-carboxytetrahydropterin synthase QueD [Candidatus Omnitrophica bacterium]|jgi:6-pyruvoyltetrahydropterin/6-carboxytetrahydropterin synthase|nr:6-carboxytetrahydropterin synthase QueD [Candidatus Omnitrophota bacterium]
MYTIRVEANFSSAHNLRGYKGKCESLHGHNWKVEVSASSKNLPSSGMLIDFRILKDAVNKLLDTLDHKYLNKIAYFKKVNPTSENIARFIYVSLKKKCPQISAVTVWESENSCATYEE